VRAAADAELEALYRELRRRVDALEPQEVRRPARPDRESRTPTIPPEGDRVELVRTLASAAFGLSQVDPSRRSTALDPIDLLAEAEVGFRGTGDAERASQAALLRADGLRRRGRLAEARDALDAALAADTGARAWRPFLLAAAADLARDRQDFEAAQTLLAEGEASLLDESRGYGPHRDARFRLAGVRGETLLDMGLPDRAALWFAEEGRLADGLKDGHRLAALFHRLRLDNAREDFAGMIARIERGLADLAPARDDPSIRGQLLVRLGIAQAERDRGRVDSATRHRGRTGSSDHGGDRPLGPASNDGDREGSTGEAIATLHEALAQPGVPDVDALSAELMLADIAIREGRLDDAESRLDAATRRIRRRVAAGDDPMRDDPVRHDAVSHDETRHDPGRHDPARHDGTCHDAARHHPTREDRPRDDPLHGAVPIRDAANLAAGRVRLALARGAPVAELVVHGEALENAYAELIAAWSATPARPGGVGFLHYGSRRRVLSDLIRVTLAVDDGPSGLERALGHVLRAQEQVTLLRRAKAPSVGLAQIRDAVLRAGVGALVYLPALDRSHVFALDRDGIVHAELPAKDAIEAVNRELLGLLGIYPQGDGAVRRARRRRFDGLAERLAEQLLPPPILREVRRWSHVVVVGAGLLGHVPFEGLPLGDEGPLGLVRAVGVAPSLPLACHLERRDGEHAAGGGSPANGEGLELALVAAPRVSARVAERWPKARPFPFPDDARRRLTSMFDEGRVAVHVDDAARPARLREAATTGSRVLQSLTHGAHDPGRERPSGLVLAADGDGDGVLWCEDVERLDAPPLVVLLACGSARGPTRRGDEGVAHLGGAFLTAGARAVVLSRTALDHDAALLLGEVFNQALSRGRSPADALREARAALAADPRGDDPFFWAPVQLLGVGAAR